jgi:hypothetical protein
MEIRISRAGQAVDDRLSRRIGAEIAAEGTQIPDDIRQQAGRDGGVDEQRLGGAANIGAAHLRIRHDPPRHRRVGARVDIGVAKPLGMGEDRHARLGLHPRDQPLAAARDDEIDEAGGRQHGRDEGTVPARGDLHGGLGQTGRAQALGDGGMDGARAVKTIGATAQDDGVAGFQADAGRIRPDIRPAFVDHADDADGHGNTAEAQAVGPGPLRHDVTQGIGQCRDLLEPDGHGLDAPRIKPQAVKQRRQPLISPQIGGVGGEDALPPGAQGGGGGGERQIALR